METLENILASKLLKIKAIKLQPNEPFTWASRLEIAVLLR